MCIPKTRAECGVRGTARIGGKKRETQCEREGDGVKARLPNGAVSGLEFEIHAARPQGPRVKKICCNVCYTHCCEKCMRRRRRHGNGINYFEDLKGSLREGRV